MTTKGRGLLVAAVIVGAVVALVAVYRDRTLRRNASKFVERYGD